MGFLEISGSRWRDRKCGASSSQVVRSVVQDMCILPHLVISAAKGLDALCFVMCDDEGLLTSSCQLAQLEVD